MQFLCFVLRSHCSLNHHPISDVTIAILKIISRLAINDQLKLLPSLNYNDFLTKIKTFYIASTLTLGMTRLFLETWCINGFLQIQTAECFGAKKIEVKRRCPLCRWLSLVMMSSFNAEAHGITRGTQKHRERDAERENHCTSICARWSQGTDLHTRNRAVLSLGHPVGHPEKHSKDAKRGIER